MQGESKIILSERQQEVRRWWLEGRTIREIAEWLDLSYAGARREVDILRAILRSHGQELPCYQLGRGRIMPVISSLPAA